MDVAKNFPLQTQLKQISASVLRRQAAPSLNSMLTTSLAQHFPTSILIQEQRYYEKKPLFHIVMEGSTSEKTTLDRRRMEIGFSAINEIWKLPSLKKEALSTSKRAALLAISYKSYKANLCKSSTPSGRSTNLADFPVPEKIVRSTRLWERKEVAYRRHLKSRPRSKRRGGMPNGRLESKLLSLKEEYELIFDIQLLIKLEKVKSRFRTWLGREPGLFEWAKVVGLSSHALNVQLHRGYHSKERIIYCYFGLVVHTAQQYQGLGLHVDDLLQCGHIGLMKGIEKFSPKFGCRLGTYAYWWIRQTIRDFIFRNSSAVPLPESVHRQLFYVEKAKRSCVQDGIHYPTNEDIATRMGITIEQLQKLYDYVPYIISLTDRQMERVPDVWNEPPSVSVEKEFMRQHIDELLNTLKPKERRIVRLRYGFEDGQPKKLVEIGEVFGFSKQRADFTVKKAMSKLRQRSQELETYKYLIMDTWKENLDLLDLFLPDEDWYLYYLINFLIPSGLIKRCRYPIIK